MSVLLLTEEDVRQLLTMDMALEAVETELRKEALEEATNIPRTRCQTDHAMLHVLAASAKQVPRIHQTTVALNRNRPSNFCSALVRHWQRDTRAHRLAIQAAATACLRS